MPRHSAATVKRARDSFAEWPPAHYESPSEREEKLPRDYARFVPVPTH